MAHQGKISRLPFDVRERVSRELRDGRKGRAILDWLNALPDVLRVLEEDYGGEPVSESNLSQYRKGEHAAWLAQQEEVDRLRATHAYAAQLGSAAGQGLAPGLVSLLIGRIIHALSSPEAEADPETLAQLLKDVPKLSNEEVKHQRVKLQRGASDAKAQELQLKRAQLALAREKWELQATELVWDKAKDAQVQSVVAGEKTPANMGVLRELLFGNRALRREKAPEESNRDV